MQYTDFMGLKLPEATDFYNVDDMNYNSQVLDSLGPKHDGFEDRETVFNANGSITETYSDRVKNTVFNQDGSITETISKNGVVIATKTTTFNQDGSISEEVL
jgi:hypothetical protein